MCLAVAIEAFVLSTDVAVLETYARTLYYSYSIFDWWAWRQYHSSVIEERGWRVFWGLLGWEVQ